MKNENSYKKILKGTIMSEQYEVIIKLCQKGHQETLIDLLIGTLDNYREQSEEELLEAGGQKLVDLIEEFEGVIK